MPRPTSSKGKGILKPAGNTSSPSQSMASPESTLYDGNTPSGAACNSAPIGLFSVGPEVRRSRPLTFGSSTVERIRPEPATGLGARWPEGYAWEEEFMGCRLGYRKGWVLCCLATGLAVLACNLPGVASPTAGPTPTSTKALTAPPAERPTATDTVPPTPPSTETPSPESTATEAEPTASLKAVGGNLTIRRGPDLAYDILGFLLDGQEVPLLGQDQAGRWYYVEVPDRPGRFGWVSGVSRFSEVSGGVVGLPVEPSEPAVPAFLRNCTFHPMLIKPGDFVLKPINDAPQNQIQVNPEVYEAFDQNVADHPKVFSKGIREGQTLEISVDGNGNTWPCP